MGTNRGHRSSANGGTYHTINGRSSGLGNLQRHGYLHPHFCRLSDEGEVLSNRGLVTGAVLKRRPGAEQPGHRVSSAPATEFL